MLFFSEREGGVVFAVDQMTKECSSPMEPFCDLFIYVSLFG